MKIHVITVLPRALLPKCDAFVQSPATEPPVG